LLQATLAILVLGAVMVLGLRAVNAGGELTGVVFVLGSAAAGLIGSEVARRTEPPRRRR